MNNSFLFIIKLRLKNYTRLTRETVISFSEPKMASVARFITHSWLGDQDLFSYVRAPYLLSVYWTRYRRFIDVEHTSNPRLFNRQILNRAFLPRLFFID